LWGCLDGLFVPDLTLVPGICLERCDFKSKSCFSGVFGYSVFSLVGELDSDDAKQSWFLLLRFLLLPLAIGLSLVFACLAVSENDLALL